MRNTQADRSIRDRKKALDERIDSLRKQRADALNEREQAKEAYASKDWDEGENRQQSSEFKDAMEATKKVGEVEEQIESLRSEREGLLAMLGDFSETDPLDRSHQGEPQQGRSLDARDLLMNSDLYKQARESGVFNSDSHFGTISLGRLGTRDDILAYMRGPVAAGPLAPATPGDVGTYTGGVVPDYRGLVPPLLQPLTLLDLIPVGTTDSNLINYVQITGLPLGAAETAELALKPALGLATTDQTAPVRTIAGYIKLARQALDDIAGLGTFMNTQLPYAVRYRLLSQILAGDGTGVNLTGLYNTSGINAPAFTVGDEIPDAVLRGITAIVVSGAQPNFVALNPLDYQKLVLTKDSTGRYLYENPGSFHSSPVQGSPSSLWGLNVTVSWAVPAGTPLVGDAQAATLLVREGLNVKTSDSDQDDFIRNRVTLLAEMRAAFVVWRPAAFAKVALA